MNQLHTMPLKVEKLLSSRRVRRMHLDELGAYVLLLAEAWLDGARLPNDENEVREMLGPDAEDEETWQRLRRFVVRRMFTPSEDGASLENATQVEIYRETLQRHEKLAEAGRKGGRKSRKSPPQAGLKPGLSEAKASKVKAKVKEEPPKSPSRGDCGVCEDVPEDPDSDPEPYAARCMDRLGRVMSVMFSEKDIRSLAKAFAAVRDTWGVSYDRQEYTFELYCRALADPHRRVPTLGEPWRWRDKYLQIQQACNVANAEKPPIAQSASAAELRRREETAQRVESQVRTLEQVRTFIAEREDPFLEWLAAKADSGEAAAALAIERMKTAGVTMSVLPYARAFIEERTGLSEDSKE